MVGQTSGKGWHCLSPSSQPATGRDYSQGQELGIPHSIPRLGTGGKRKGIFRQWGIVHFGSTYQTFLPTILHCLPDRRTENSETVGTYPCPRQEGARMEACPQTGSSLMGDGYACPRQDYPHLPGRDFYSFYSDLNRQTFNSMWKNILNKTLGTDKDTFCAQ